MRVRISWVRCPDCGRRGTNGGCFVVEQIVGLWLFKLVRPLLVTYDRAGSSMAEHYPTEVKAHEALNYYLAPKAAERRVVYEANR